MTGKKILILACGVLSVQCLSAGYALSNCADKIQHIQTQLDYAVKNNNAGEIDGLKKALNATAKNCDDSKLDTQHQQKVEEKQRKLEERQSELDAAKANGNEEKIDKLTKKRDRAQNELDEAKQQLDH